MNKRIRELADQAVDYADQNFKGEPTWFEAQESKFAELIIKECADLFAVEYGNSGVSGHEVARVLKKHFGVKP